MQCSNKIYLSEKNWHCFFNSVGVENLETVSYIALSFPQMSQCDHKNYLVSMWLWTKIKSLGHFFFLNYDLSFLYQQHAIF